MRLPLALTCAFILLAAAPAAAAAAQRTRDVPQPGAIEPRAFPNRTFRDRVITGRRATARVAKARAHTSATRRVYRTPDGHRVEVFLSNAYAPNPAIDRLYVNYVYSLLHDFELGRLKIWIGSPREIGRLCGEDSVACYVSNEDRVYVAGENTPDGTVAEALSHEYGHHLASWRDNPPWDAIDWGPKRWASHEWVCAGVRRGRFKPGNQGSRYADDPGESFAEGYSFLNTNEREWAYNDRLRPNAAAYAVIRRDVYRPWTRRKTKRLRGRLSQRRNRRGFALRVRLDGQVGIRLRGPRGSNYDLEVRSGGRLLKRTRRRGSRDRLKVNLCRATGRASKRATILVKRRFGSGRFRLRVRYPG